MEEAVARPREPHLGVDAFGLPKAPLVEVMQAEPGLVRGYVGAVMEHADFLACSMEELAAVVREWCAVKVGE